MSTCSPSRRQYAEQQVAGAEEAYLFDARAASLESTARAPSGDAKVLRARSAASASVVRPEVPEQSRQDRPDCGGVGRAQRADPPLNQAVVQGEELHAYH